MKQGTASIIGDYINSVVKLNKSEGQDETTEEAKDQKEEAN